MTSQVIINNVEPRTQIISTSSQTVFDTDWTANADSDINVYVTAPDAIPSDELDLVSSSDYTVSYIGGEETVRVTFLSGQTLDAVVTIARDTPADRLNLYTNTNFTPSMLNQDVGILTLVDQQNEMYDKNLTPHYNVCSQFHDPASIDLVLPVLPPLCTWVMNSTATGIDAIPFSGGGGGGSVNPSTTPNISWYAESGSTVSGFPGVANAILASTADKTPQWLPSTDNKIMGSNSTGPEWFGPFAQGQVAMGGSGGIPLAGELVAGDGITIDTGTPGQITINSTTTTTGPTRQIFTSGSGTYVRPAGVQWIEIEMIGGGGGGGGSGASAGTSAGPGGTSLFGTITQCTGGSPGSSYSGSGGGGAGGVGSSIAPAVGFGVIGGSGTSGGQFLNTVAGDCVFAGGAGGSGALGGGGGGGQNGNAGGNGVRGGGGGGASGVWTGGNRRISGGGGGAGGYLKLIVSSPDATYTYTVGAAGTAGGAGTGGSTGDPAYAGGAGGAGMIVVWEYY